MLLASRIPLNIGVGRAATNDWFSNRNPQIHCKQFERAHTYGVPQGHLSLGAEASQKKREETPDDNRMQNNMA